jgi:hypothetical protein
MEIAFLSMDKKTNRTEDAAGCEAGGVCHLLFN